VLANELKNALAVIQPLAQELAATVIHEENVSKVSVVGAGMRTHTGVAERMFAALSQAGVNMKMITTGDIKISVLVDKADGVKALRAVHQAFQLHERRPAANGAGGPRSSVGRKRHPLLEEASRDLLSLTQHLSSMEDIVVSGVLLNTDDGRITISHLPDEPGNCSRVFQAVAAGGVVVDMIVQNVSAPGRAQLSFSVPRADVANALKRTQEAVQALDKDTRVTAEEAIAKLMVLGVGMRTHTGVARRMFGALAERGINISMINTSEVCVSVVVDGTRGQEALRCLKQAFHVA
jgi:aspartate kinase